MSSGAVQQHQHTTKGERIVDLLIPGDLTGRRTAVMQAIRRKSMLYGRFLSWSRTEFGPAGERVVRESLSDAIRHGFHPITPGFGEVATLGKTTIRGPLDSGAWMVVTDPATNLPLPVHALLIEIKNRRQTLYPRHREVHQLLYKAAHLQAEMPDQPMVPVLICRRAHNWLFWMAKDLGFIAHATRAQYTTLPPKTEVRHFEEVRDELGLTDLRLITATSAPRIINLFIETLPKQAPAVAERWRTVGCTLLDHYKALLEDQLAPWARTATLSALRTAASDALDAAGVDPDEQILAWALEEIEEDDFDVPDWW